MSANVSEQVRRFISDFWRTPLERLEPQTKLEEDLGITGDDAWELLQKFGERFDIDLASLEFYKHFGPEGWGCNPLWLLCPPPGMSDYRKYPVTVDHLVRVAEIKRWFCPPRTG